ncbi:PMGT1-like protein [Mya arenaria]|uniref:Alpha-1,3-mannosyl-glycoprotein 2-beta-N-acetylglucosaminyltransferase n=1 Tax=Mya arenaria TaxID=6604 RepID=A0ABY7FMK2_MYAAR|nr:PMGT1-like protein [Mya arenaria]
MISRRMCGHKNCYVKICKSGLLLMLVVSLVINISFIIDTRQKLHQQTGAVGHEKGDIVHTVHPQADIKPSPALRQARVEVTSSKQLVAVKVNGRNVYLNDGFDEDRGIHVLVLNQANLEVMARKVFDTYQKNEDDDMLRFLSNISPGRIIVYAIKDEGTFNLQERSRGELLRLGSESAPLLHWRDTWAFIARHKKGGLGESYGESKELTQWAEPAILTANITLENNNGVECASWPDTPETARRREFCQKYEGYGAVCSCGAPEPLSFTVKPLEVDGVLDVPVTIIASNRPAYLYRMLRRLLQTSGVPVDKITEPLDVTRLFNIRGIQHAPLGQKNARIAQHYKASLTATFNFFPDSGYVIIIEEDLDVSPDFFLYFQQTMHLLDEDPTLYCISAWNDQGYDHSCADETLLYRIETMPGLGWMMKKSLYKDELEPQWPAQDKQWDWDMWMRHGAIRKSRECIIPDISRTYHFGSKGLNINPYFQEIYFNKHKLQSKPNVRLKDVDRMTSEKYEVLVRDLIKGAKVLDHSKDPCAEDFIPKTDDSTYVMYIQMKEERDFETWKQLAKCYKLWDLDVRGFHKSMWRNFLHGKHLVLVGVPASPYSDLKPDNVHPIFLQEKKENKE